jgi:glycerol-3-phosphate O-acyltransferase
MDSMKSMGDLINAGGNIIWLAPSGGRDRPDESGRFVVAPFDYKSLDMFKLMAMQSNRPLHFFPMAMYTHKLVPPPDAKATAEIGESRSAKRGPVSIAWLPETDGLGGLKDKEFSKELEESVALAYGDLCAWHDANQ